MSAHDTSGNGPAKKKESRPLLISSGFDPDCELCRAIAAVPLSEGDPEVLGPPLEGTDLDVREILDLDRVKGMFIRRGSDQKESPDAR